MNLLVRENKMIADIILLALIVIVSVSIGWIIKEYYKFETYSWLVINVIFPLAIVVVLICAAVYGYTYYMGKF